MKEKRFWWAWRPTDARGAFIDDCILLGIWGFVAFASAMIVASRVLRGTTLDQVAMPFFLLALAIGGASTVIRRLRATK